MSFPTEIIILSKPHRLLDMLKYQLSPFRSSRKRLREQDMTIFSFSVDSDQSWQLNERNPPGILKENCSEFPTVAYICRHIRRRRRVGRPRTSSGVASTSRRGAADSRCPDVATRVPHRRQARLSARPLPHGGKGVTVLCTPMRSLAKKGEKIALRPWCKIPAKATPRFRVTRPLVRLENLR